MKIYYTHPSLNIQPRNAKFLKGSFKSTVKQSNFKNSIDSWIESNNSFYFQIVGVFILTIGMVLSLQNFLDGTKLNASAKENSSVRILTNFQQSTKTSADTNKLKEVTGIVTPVENINPKIQEEQNYVEYTIKTNDTISSVAAKFKVTVEDISKLNILEPNASLTVGTKIKVPFGV
jgi:LysM repeat protein